MMELKCGIYVHLCCEGWVRSGSFEWVAVGAEREAADGWR